MQPAVSDIDLTAQEREQLRDLLARFEAAGLRTGPVEFGAFLPAPGDRLYAAALCALIKCDMEIRWRGGRPIHLEDYLSAYPDLRDDATNLIQLLVEEYRIRERHGNRP